MTVQGDLKQRIRTRRAKTGESYTTARAHVLRAREPADEQPAAQSERVSAIVLKGGDTSLRIRLLGESEGDAVTLRCSSYDAMRVAPAQLIEATLRKRWTWRGDAYASGSITRVWTDVSALDLEPLKLEDHGICDLNEVHDRFEPPDPYAVMWDFFASTPRHEFEFEGVAWGLGVGVDAGDFDTCLVSEAAEIGEYDRAEARDLLMQVLLADLRCIDAHSHLGNLAFDHCPQDAITHYEIAVAIGEQSLGASFSGMLPWSCIYNRPFLRALHGYGLCLWRLGRAEQAREVFERILALNPADNQGARFCWNDIRNDQPWTQEGVEEAHGSADADH